MKMGGYEYVNYWYSKSHFSIHNGVVEGFCIRDKNFAFENIRVGYPLKVFSKKYPKSFKKDVDITEDEFVIKLFITSVPTTIKFYNPDFVYFNIKNGRVEYYETWTAW
jgi:hypothetical protein